MRLASSARATCNALRSASEYTPTVRMPMRFAVRITRQAISPRLAIRILRNTLALPRGLALLEERRDAFFALGRGADLGDAPRGLRFQFVVDRPAGDIAHQLLDARVRRGAAGEQVVEQLADEGVELGRLHKRREQSDAQRLFDAEYFGGQEVAARGARADRAHDVRADRRGRETELRLREGELRLRCADRDVARGHEPRATGKRGPVHARDRRL